MRKWEEIETNVSRQTLTGRQRWKHKVPKVQAGRIPESCFFFLVNIFINVFFTVALIEGCFSKEQKLWERMSQWKLTPRLMEKSLKRVGMGLREQIRFGQQELFFWARVKMNEDIITFKDRWLVSQRTSWWWTPYFDLIGGVVFSLH
jgi:hypothetical protein